MRPCGKGDDKDSGRRRFVNLLSNGGETGWVREGATMDGSALFGGGFSSLARGCEAEIGADGGGGVLDESISVSIA